VEMEKNKYMKYFEGRGSQMQWLVHGRLGDKHWSTLKHPNMQFLEEDYAIIRNREFGVKSQIPGHFQRVDVRWQLKGNVQQMILNVGVKLRHGVVDRDQQNWWVKYRNAADPWSNTDRELRMRSEENSLFWKEQRESIKDWDGTGQRG
jgi:hypothetical protein